MHCRHCNTELKHEFVDLVSSPPANSFLSHEELNEPEVYYPLKLYVCHECFLVQIDEYKKATEIFNNDYIYYSSFSKSWLEHAKRYTEMMQERFGINEDSMVVEIASNDGYLLQYFKEKNVSVLGIEPTRNTAAEAVKKGISTITDYFSKKLAVRLGLKANLLIGNNVLAHVPDINDFVSGMKMLLADDGIITMEFPHLLKLIEECQFDTIYHEHFSYLSFVSVKRIFEAQGLEMFDVQEISTHGGSLRIFAKHAGNQKHQVTPNVEKLLQKEEAAGLKNIGSYADFQSKVSKIKYDFLLFLLEKKKEGKRIAAYGAAAKGNTFLNYCGVVGTELIEFAVDASPYKQNKYLPGSHIPVVNEYKIKEQKPDYVVILPWNLRDEISKQLSYIGDWGGQFVTCIPDLKVISPKKAVQDNVSAQKLEEVEK
ncbi:class I SAM-dependent methyltransferase [Cytophagaceae bacterium YF14B1]|uniref:Class I SAM-dependent methyltransferase n=1 Tax=Xanthocytophaga flava TaxID=3048013 RepID=A0AAE3U7I5_9BACT|nr:class I SAM-dependent methyltransferase [Xanthocytophaga flavus]MDJ1481637.1 class I SAM-dependent methyltransferase [Xanthocytophaga flavus]